MRYLLYTFIYLTFNISDYFEESYIRRGKISISISEIKSTLSCLDKNIADHERDIKEDSNPFEYDKYIRRISPKFIFDNYISSSFGKINKYQHTAVNCVKIYCINTLIPIVALRKLRI